MHLLCFTLHSSTLQDMGVENDIPIGAAEDEAAAFRRLQSRRKAKALEFLRDKFATFNLLLTCSLAQSMSRITAYCFELVNADKEDLTGRVPDRQEERKRRRMRRKGPEAFLEEEHRRKHLQGVKLRVQQFLSKAWDDLLSEGMVNSTVIPGAFWPRDEPPSSRFKTMAEHMLRNVAAVKWRLMVRFSTPPWSFAHLHPDASPESLGKSLQELLDASPCCLDPWWALPLQKHLLTLDEDAQQVRFRQAVGRLLASLRPVSLREEQSHAVQRRLAGGDVAGPLTSNTQRAASVKKTYELRGGRNLDHAPPKVLKAIKKRKSRPGVFKRPHQTGNCLFFFVAQKRKQGDQRSKAELVAEWNALSEQSKQWWQSKFKINSSIKRQQAADAKKFAQDHPAPDVPTPWDIGDEVFPIKPESFRAFLDGFHGKAAGLATLRKLVAESGSNLEIEEYIEQVESRAEPYHMKKALDLFCKHELGPALDSDTIRQCSLAREIMATKPLRLGCFAEHPGLCKCKHEGERPQVQQFMKLVPNKSCLLRFCVGNLVAYARCILGNMSAPDSTGSHLTRIFDGLMKFCGEEFRGLTITVPRRDLHQKHNGDDDIRFFNFSMYPRISWVLNMFS